MRHGKTTFYKLMAVERLLIGLMADVPVLCPAVLKLLAVIQRVRGRIGRRNNIGIL